MCILVTIVTLVLNPSNVTLLHQLNGMILSNVTLNMAKPKHKGGYRRGCFAFKEMLLRQSPNYS